MADIVVGYDGSDGANAALDEAARLAEGLGDRVVLVFGYAPHGSGGGEVATHREAVREFGEQVTANGLERAKAAGADASVELIAKHPAHALEEAATEHSARMIVVGSYGERPLKAVIIGSTPYKLLHEAERPVLVVTARGE